MIVYRKDIGPVAIHAHDDEIGAPSGNITMRGDRPHFLSASIHLSVDEMRAIASALTEAADKAAAFLSPSTETAESLPADGGAFSSEGA